MSLYKDLRFFVRKYRHKYYVNSRWGRILVKSLQTFIAALVVIAAGLVLYKLANMPRPLHLDSSAAKDRFNKAEVIPENQLVIKDIIAGQDEVLLSHDTEATDLVRVFFDEAQLTSRSVERLKEQNFLDIPEGSGPAEYIYEESKNYSKDAASRKTTHADIKIKAQSGQPFTLFIHPVKPASGDEGKAASVEVRTEGDGGSLIVTTYTKQPVDSSFERRILLGKGMGWNQPVHDKTSLEFIVPPNKKITFNIVRIDGEAFSSSSPPRLFNFGAQASQESGHAIRAREVSVTRMAEQPATSTSHAFPGWPRETDNSLLLASAANPGETLSVSDFQLDSRGFTVRISGYAMASVEGDYLNRDITGAIENNKIASLALVSIGGVLIGWFGAAARNLYLELRNKLP